MKNKVITGDCIEVMRGMESEFVDLIATDPPFNTGRDFGAYLDRWEWGGARQAEYEDLGLDAQLAVDAAYRLHSESMAAFCCFLGVRLVEMHRILKPSGSIYLHCDSTANSYIRLLLDAVFDAKHFRNEIKWCYSNQGRGNSAWAKKSDSIFYYVKTSSAPLNNRVPISDEYFNKMFRHTDENGRKCRKRFDKGAWRYYYREDGMIGNDWWSEFPPLAGAKEFIGYPTQKPIALYSRIIQASCPEKGWVLDPFAGSGTTLVAAHRLGRCAIGIDVNPESKSILEERLRGA